MSQSPPASLLVVGEICAAGVMFAGCGLVEDRTDLDATDLSISEGFGDIGAGETVRLHIDARSCLSDLFHDGLRPAALGTKIDGYALVGNDITRPWRAGKQDASGEEKDGGNCEGG